jgi:hypothetical protein
MSEKIVVEFEVEETVNRDFGYQEKMLKYCGDDTRYKAIVKDGKLVAILGRGYKLIPNEKVDELVQKLDGEKECRKEGWRWYWIIRKNEAGAIIANSVDGTEALKVYAWLPRVGALLVTSRVQNVYRRHTPKADLSDFAETVNAIVEMAEQYKKWLQKLDAVSAKENIEVLEMLAAEMPKKYVEKPLLTARAGKDLSGATFTLKMFYEAVARAIWNAETDMRTKMRLYRSLNDAMFTIVEWEGEK